MTVKPCIFCDVRPETGFRIAWENKDFIAFHDIAPHGKLHLLVIPRKHYGTIKDLTSEDTTLLKSMIQHGKELLTKHGYSPENSRMGFHRPPFNSQPHLHLHVVGLPFSSFLHRLAFTSGMPWFADAENVLTKLSKL
ncbi:uncharacterized protein VTP21DRAFT_3566 [Calcarisporiella thermophila]|uniref:uncharacterized protein n=1 Tax=Calcarisporiella thermophila TaxID=911321 RepID=UPI003743B5F7